MMGIFKNKILLLMTFILTILLLCSMNKSIVYEEVAFDVDGALREEVLKEEGYFDKKIVIALQNEDFDEVEMYQSLANYLHQPLAKTTLEAIALNNDFLSKAIRNTKEFTQGAIDGKGNSSVAMAGSILSDMTVVGDLRDLSVEGSKYANNEKYDKVILGVSVIGVGLSASQLLSGGTSTPLKVGASVIKMAKKTGKISKPFLAILSSKVTKAVDMKLLKTLDFSTVNSLKRVTPIIAKSFKLKGLKKIFGNINLLRKKTSTFDTLSLLKYVNSEKDLQKMVKLSGKYKKNTKGVFKVLGRTALRGATRVAKYTTLFMAELISMILSFVAFIVGFFLNVKTGIAFFRKAKAKFLG